MLLNSQKHNPAFIINSHSISPKDSLQYLGVLCDNKLRLKLHVNK